MQEIKYDYNCPNCGKKIKINAYPLINLQSDKNLYKDLFSLDLFRIECDYCKHIFMIQYDTIIVDMYKKYIVYLFLSDTKENFYKNINDVIENKFKLNMRQNEIWNELKHTRLVTSLNELLEKLLIFDYDLDDRIIELIKRGLYQKNRLDEEIYESIRFNKLEKDSLLFTCFNTKDIKIQPIDIAVDIKYYNIMIDSLGGLTNIKSENFALIDKEWAKTQILKG